MPYTDVFGGSTIYPSQQTYLSLVLTANVVLAWPIEQQVGGNVVADIIDVDSTGPSFSIDLPDARQVSEGYTALFNNIGSNTFTVRNADGATLVSPVSGSVWQLYLSDNSTPGGTWRVFQFGASVSTAAAAALAGAGIKASGSLLDQSMPVTTLAATTTLTSAFRARAVVWTGGIGTLTLPNAGGVGSDWFFNVRNNGTGSVNLTPPSGLIDGAASKSLAPGQGGVVFTDGVNYFSLGIGSAGGASAFDFVSIDVSGAGDYTLSGVQLNRIAYRFTGTLTGNRNIIVPSSIQQYWVNNATSGAFTFFVKTVSQTPGVEILQNNSGILYCDGTNVVDGESSTVSFPIPVAQGGTGAVNAATARLNLGATTIGDGLFVAADAAAARTLLSVQPTANPTFTGTVTGGTFAGSGASLTNLPAANLTGILPALNAAALTNLTAANLVGALPAISGAALTNLNASNLASGTVPDARFPATLPAANGSNLTNLNATNLATGTVADARLSSNVALRNASNTFTGGSLINSSTIAASSWSLQLTGAAGAARDILLAGQSGFSNGFTVQFNGTQMQYGFLNGNVTISAPTSGVALSVTGASGGTAMQLNPVGSAFGLIVQSAAGAFSGIQLAQTGQAAAAVYQPASSSDLRLQTNSVDRIAVSNTGNVTINAPASGTPLRATAATGQLYAADFFAGPANTDYAIVRLLGASATGLVGVGNSLTANTAFRDTAIFGTQNAFGAAIVTNDAARMTVSSVGNISINAPASGTTLVVNAAASTPAAQIGNIFMATGAGLLGGTNRNLYTFGTDIFAIGTIDSAEINFRTASASRARVGTSNAESFQAMDDGGAMQTVGWRDMPQNAQAGSYTLAVADRGKYVQTSGGSATITIPANGVAAFPIGSVVTLYNVSGGNQTVAQGAGATLTWAGVGSTGNRTLSDRGLATVLKTGTDSWVISGVGLS